MSTPVFRFDPPPQFSKNILIALLALYVAEVILEQWTGLPLAALLAWHPTDLFSKPWQPITHFLYQGSNPFNTLLELLALYFFLPPAQRAYGRKGIYRIALYVLATVVVFGAFSLLSGAVNEPIPATGIGPMVTALIVIFGLSNPYATIYLLFFPIQASWIAWGTGLFASLGFLYSRTLPSALWLAGWIAGYLFIESRPGGKLRRLWVKRQHDKRNKRLNRFTVIDGGKDETFH